MDTNTSAEDDEFLPSLLLAMEWYIMNSTGVRSIGCSLGEMVSDNQYILHDECADTVEELLGAMYAEDPRKCVTKRHLLAEQLITKDLIPMIKFGSPDVNELALILRLFGELCEPVVESGFVPPLDNHIKNDLIKLTRQVRKAFLDTDFVSKLFAHIQELIAEAGEQEMTQEAYDSIKHLLKMVRNILHFAKNEDVLQIQALQGLLLKNGLSCVLIYSITCHGKDELVAPVCQTLSLLFSKFKWKVNADKVCASTTASLLAEKYVSDKLKRLIVQLLQGPLSAMAVSLKKKELREPTDMECIYISWCLTYFLPYISHVPVPISKFRGVISNKFIGYLVYQVSAMVPKLFGKEQMSTKVQQGKQRCMMLFSAIESLLTLVSNYKFSSASTEEVKAIMQFHKDLVNMTDLWQILLFYIRNFDITSFPRSFLFQLICINHNLLTSVEFYNRMCSGQLEQTVLEHIRQFADVRVLQRYALVVETYSTNSVHTNLAAFTMLSHICVDCERIDLLYTPTLLRLMGEVAANPEANDDDRQLATYVTQSFIDDLSAKPEICVQSFMNSVPETMDVTNNGGEQESSPTTTTDWTDSEESDLMSVYADLTDPSVETVTERLNHAGINCSTQQVAEKLVQLGLISDSTVQTLADITDLVKEICEEGNSDFIMWIRSSLLAASYVKAMSKDDVNISPLCYYSFLKGHSYPVIPYTERQSMFLQPKVLPLFNHLHMECLELSGTYIPLIPESLNAATLYAAADRLRMILEDTLGYVSSGNDSLMESDMFKPAENATLAVPQTTSVPRTTNSGDPAQKGDLNLWLSYMQSTSKT